MTTGERVQALVDYGFTERQAGFLVLVLRHSGLCVKRQYAAFAGVANGGEKCNAFFDKLVRRGHAVATPCVHNRARLYHVHNRALYHVIGEVDSRYRRPVSARSFAERLMRLDAALLSPACDWLTRRSEKLSYLHARTALTAASGPADPSTIQAARDLDVRLPGTFPIGIDHGGKVVLLYVAAVPWTDAFRAFVLGHTALLAVTPSWLLRVVLSPALRRVLSAYETVSREELDSRLDEQTIADLKYWYFHQRRRTDRQAIPDELRARLKRHEREFGGPRFTHLYRRWLQDEDAALTPIPSAIPDALASGRAAIECVVLPHSYDHLVPVVDRHHLRRAEDTADAEEGDDTPRGINPLLNPVP